MPTEPANIRIKTAKWFYQELDIKTFALKQGVSKAMDEASIFVFKNHLLHALRNADLQWRSRVRGSVQHELAWARAQEAALIAYRLNVITGATYVRMRRFLNGMQ